MYLWLSGHSFSSHPACYDVLVTLLIEFPALIRVSLCVCAHTAAYRVYKEERNYIVSMVKKIKASGCNVLLIQKSILRDATTELSLHYLAKAKIMVVRDIERSDIEFIAKVRDELRAACTRHLLLWLGCKTSDRYCTYTYTHMRVACTGVCLSSTGKSSAV